MYTYIGIPLPKELAAMDMRPNSVPERRIPRTGWDRGEVVICVHWLAIEMALGIAQDPSHLWLLDYGSNITIDGNNGRVSSKNGYKCLDMPGKGEMDFQAHPSNVQLFIKKENLRVWKLTSKQDVFFLLQGYEQLFC